tara:strand:+ start:6539 stop:7375 length:837 start_codon:yes stop_codon:yes gene_type:complete
MSINEIFIQLVNVVFLFRVILHVTQPLNLAKRVYSSRKQHVFCAKKYLVRSDKVITKSSMIFFCGVVVRLSTEKHIMQRLRKLPRTSKILRLSGFSSLKNHARMYCESILEGHALLLCEFDDTVLRYTTQPFSIAYTLFNRKRHYTPDILLKLKCGAYQSVEVKPFDKLQSERNLHKFEVLQALFLKEVGHELRLLTDRDIYKGEQVNNYQSLYPYLRSPLTLEENRFFLSIPSLLTFKQLSNFRESSFTTAMRLVAHSNFNWDIFSPLNSESILKKK